MVEARLHLLELREARDKSATETARRMDLSLGRPQLLRSARAADGIPDLAVAVHLAGLLRAMGSALDCLAGVVIGVAAVPQPILWADFGNVTRKYLWKVTAEDSTKRIHADLGLRLREIIDQAGPQGWLDWTLAYRNMVVHRGRHQNLKRLVPTPSRVVTPAGQRMPITRRVEFSGRPRLRRARTRAPAAATSNRTCGFPAYGFPRSSRCAP